MTKSLLAIALTAVTLSLACGCRGGKVEQCNRQIKVINEDGEAIKAATARMNAANNDMKPVEDLAASLEKAATDVQAVELKDETLKQYATEYEQMLRNGAKAARSMVEAQQAKDLEALKKAVADISKVGPIEAELITRVNGYCAQ